MKYRHAWPGLLLLTTLVGLLGALLMWGEHFLSPGPSGGLLRMLQLWGASRPAEEALHPHSPPSAAPEPPPAGTPAAADSPIPVVDTPVPAPAPAAAPVPETAPAAAPAAEPPTRTPRPPVSQARFALDLGAYSVEAQAERVEAQLNQAGFTTVRFRQQTPVGLFTVLVPLDASRDGPSVLERLKGQGFVDAMPVTGPNGPALRVALPLPLRSAVEMAERVQAAGLEVRVTAEPARRSQISLRHGNFASRQEAEAVSREIARLGVPNEVVRLK